MKHFLRTVIFGFLGLIALTVAVFVLRVGCDMPQVNRAYQVPEETAFLFVGDSHIGCSVVSGSQRFVLWNNSSAPLFSLLRLMELERRGALRPGMYCVTEIGYQTLYAEAGENSRRNALICMAPVAWRWPALFSPIITVKAWLSYVLNGGGKSCDEPPTDNIIPFSSRPEAFQEALLTDTWGKHFAFAEDMRSSSVAWHMDALTRICELCSRNGLRLVIFSSPVHPLYLDRVPDYAKADLGLLKQHLLRLGIPYLDFMDVFPETAFRDDNHLLRSEARRFTQFLIERIYAVTRHAK